MEKSDEKPAWRAWVRWGDLLIAMVLFWVGTTVWTTGGGGELPWWAGPHDALLEGPDAGEWASNALAFADGRYLDLDPHRMPTYLIFTGFTTKLVGSVALAGHLVNHLTHALLGVVLYLLGASLHSRAAGVLAALVAVTSPLLVAASWRFGVDPTVAFVVPLSVLCGVLGGRHWRLSPVAGAAAILVTAAHFSTLFHGLPVLLAVLLFGRGWKGRLLSIAGFAVGAWAVNWWIFSRFPFVGLDGLMSAIPEGVVPGSQSTSGHSGVNMAPAIATIRAGLGDGLEGALTGVLTVLHTSIVPWGVSVAAFWLGVLGPGLKRVNREGVELPLHRRFDLKGGLVLLACLAPLPLLSAAGAPPRYGYNLLPVAILLYARGLVSMAAIAQHLIEKLSGRFASGLSGRLSFLGGVAVVGWVVAIVVGGNFWREAAPRHEQRPPNISATAAMVIGEQMRELSPEYGGAVSPLREALIYANKRYCPTTVCPDTDHLAAYWDCLEIADRECSGDGPIPWVGLWRATHDERSPARVAMDAWVAEEFGVESTVEVPMGNPEFKANISLIPRERLRDRAPQRY